MPKDETPAEQALQPLLLPGVYGQLYPSLGRRLREILVSHNPAIKAKVAVLAAVVQRRDHDRRIWISELYGLTPTEARLAVHVADGGAVAAFASENGVAVGTVRTHLKAVFAKTGIHRQSDLVRLIVGLDRK